MKPKSLVKISNYIGVIAIVLLIYWVFIFISIQVFGFKVFKENMTETFYLSIFGILALMSGALMINMMFNLTRIAEKHNNDVEQSKKTSKKYMIALLVSFPVLFGILFAGDYFTSKKKENLLIQSAKEIIDNNAKKSEVIVNYKFDKSWLENTDKTLDIISKTDKNFPNVKVIVKDTIGDTNYFLGFRSYYKSANDTTAIKKSNYILRTTLPERTYLDKVFKRESTENRFTAHDGNYELFYPYQKNGKIVVFYFSDYQRYGKFGS